MDRIHRVPRVWSNRQLAEVSHLVTGDVVNVSAWKDDDKQGRKYRDYFSSARSYSITNFDQDKRGFQGLEGELFLDLEKDLPEALVGKFDCVFNHTTLEHVFDFELALDNLTAMTKDLIILVVPFLQPMHSHYGDYWRFSPMAIARMLERRGFEIGRLNFNNHPNSSVYVFCVATRIRSRWEGNFEFDYSLEDSSLPHYLEPFAGAKAIRPNWVSRISRWARFKLS